MYFCLFLSRQQAAGPFLWPWLVTGAMALAEELAPAAVSLGVGACECLCVCPSMSLPCLYIFWELMKVEGWSPGNRLEAQLALLSHPVLIWYSHRLLLFHSHLTVSVLLLWRLIYLIWKMNYLFFDEIENAFEAYVICTKQTGVGVK